MSLALASPSAPARRFKGRGGRPRKPNDPVLYEALMDLIAYVEATHPENRERLTRTGINTLAETLGISPQAVCQWTCVPPAHLKAVSTLTRGVFTPERLRPDLFA